MYAYEIIIILFETVMNKTFSSVQHSGITFCIHNELHESDRIGTISFAMLQF